MANETFNVTIGANMDVSGILGGVKQIQGAFNGLKLPTNVTANMTKDFDKLKESLTKFKALSEKESFSKTDIKNLSKLQGEIDGLFNKLSSSFNEISGKKIYLEADTTKIKEVQGQIDQLKTDIQTKLSGIKIDFGSAKGGIASLGLDEMISGFERGVKSSKVLSRAMEEVKQSLQLGNFGDASNQLTTIINKASELKGAGAGLLTFFNQIGLIKLDKPAADMAKTKEGAEQLKAALQLILPIFEQDSAAIKKMAEELGQLGGKKTDLEKIAQTNIDKKMNEGEDATRRLGGAMKETGASAVGMAEATNRAANEVKQLQQSTQYFFSLRNMINLLKRGLREAMTTIKELDAAMTQTAVVTKFDVGDMWAKLPEYTANANALGASVKDMYEATTLYYQQGLNAQQAMGIATETMKMARIGGLDAADATDKMTAALRGFNMELNETSAQRVNDVYSNLAAKTASDTNELGTAMQRTASIAASAGMSFEGTAAFLAQAIETTREPAENLGTAMKTIVARFTELKKNPLEIAEVEGEEVSYNKVDTALQSIGVSLKDANGQFRNLDQVFLDISQRWNSLTQTQQRYIATTAAGSRQQSRFIAMMSNYERTTQLMEYANNANGASNEQFGKTLESLEAKLNKLKNAWKEFLMGIMNDKITKTIVDGTTKVLNIVTKLIDVLSFNGKSGLIKSMLSIGTAFMALRGAGGVVNRLIGGLGGMIDPRSTARQGMQQGAIGRNSAQAFNQPIVKELQSIYNLIAQKIGGSQFGRNPAVGPYDEYNKFKSARAAIAEMKGGGKVSELTKHLTGLSANSQNLLMRGNSAVFRAATDAILKQYNKGDRIDVRKGERFLNNQRKSGEITAEQYYRALQDPGLLKQAMVKAGVNQNNAAYKYVEELDKQITTKANNITQARIDERMGAFQKNNPEATEEATAAYRKRLEERYKSGRWQEAVRKRAAKEEMPEPNPAFSTSKFGKMLDGVGKLGSGISQAGMGIQAFGSILTSSANPALQMFGSVLTTMGGLVSGIGMGISGLAAGFTAVAESTFIETIASKTVMAAKFGEAAASTAITAALFILVAAIAAIAIAIKKHNENIRKAAEDVSTNYRDKSKQTETNVNNLIQWREELPRLAQGVDANGMNINLDPTDYQRYLEIVDGIAEINPDIVEGYNAQGHAIIDVNTALEKTLALEKQHSDQILDNYTNTEAWTKLLRARNLERRRYSTGADSAPINQGKIVQYSGYELKPKQEMKNQAVQIGNYLYQAEKQGLLNIGDLGIDLSQLAQGNAIEVDKFIKDYDKIRQRVNSAMEEAGDEWKEKSKESIAEGFSSFDDASEELDELVGPLYDSIVTYASQSAQFQDLAPELKQGFLQGIRTLAEDANIESESQMRQVVDGMTSHFSVISDRFEDAMQDVDTAREIYARNLSETEYDDFIHKKGGPIDQLQQLRDEIEDEPNSQGWVEWIDNTIEQIENRTLEGAMTIKEAFNTLSDEIAAAEGAEENFNKKTETDFATASKGMKSIYDTAMEKDDNGNYTHRGFKGDNTYWLAAEELLGDVSGKTKKEVDALMDSVEPLLREGPEGFANFVTKVRDSKGALSDLIDSGAIVWDEQENFISSIDEAIDPDVYTKLAEALGISENLLVSLLNKGRQFANIDFSRNKEIRTAMGNDSNTIVGRTETYKNTETGKEEERKVYIMTDAELRENMGEADYASRGEQKREELREEGIYVAKAIKEYTGKDAAANAKELAKEAGISIKKGRDSSEINRELIEKFGDKYNKEDLTTIALATAEAQKGKELSEAEVEAIVSDMGTAYQEYEESADYPVLTPVLSIEALLKELVSSQHKDEIEKGKLSEESSQVDEIKDAVYGQDDKVDSLVENFGQGKDARGEALNQTTYEKSLKELNSLEDGLKDYEKSLQEGFKHAKGEDKQAYIDELAYVGAALKYIEEQKTSGKKYYEEGETGSDTSGQESPSTTSQGSDSGSNTEGKEDKSDPNVPQKVQVDWENAEKGGKLAADTGSESSENNLSGAKAAGEELKEETKNWWSNLFSGSTEPSTTTTEPQGSESTESEGNLTSAAENLSNAAISLSEASTNLNSAAQALNLNNQPQSNGLPPGVAGPPTPPSTQTTSSTPNQISGTPTIDTTQAVKSLDDLKTKAEETQETINKGAKFTIQTPGSSRLAKAAKSAQDLSKTSGEKTIKVKTGKVDTDSVKTATQTIGNKEAKIKVGANVDQATARINRLIRETNAKTATIDVIADYSKSKWTHDVDIYVHEHKATGSHNHGYAETPTFNSAAKGYGQVGPKGKGGLTLTGELGYEIAWLPDENRSMILGANGPQMVDLPGNAVVWTHEQSKKILKQKAIPAGSHADYTGISGINDFMKQFAGGSNGGKGSTPSGGRGTTTTRNNNNNIEPQVEKIIAKAGKVLVWWENMARKVDAVQRKADKNQKELEKTLKTYGKRASDAEKIAKVYRKNLQGGIKLNQAEVKRANKELKNLDKSKKKSKEQISYEVTKKKGKKKTKTTQKENVSLSKFIKYDPSTGTYVIDQKQITRVAKKNKSKAEAIKTAAEQAINDKINKRNTAEDRIEKAREELEKLNNDIYNTFYSWEKSITEIYLLSQKLEVLSKRLSVVTSQSELQFSKMEAGASTAEEGLTKVQEALAKQSDLLLNKADGSYANLLAAKKEYEDSLNLKTYLEEFAKKPDSTDAQNKLVAAKEALAFLQEAQLEGDNFNYTAAIDKLNNTKMSTTEYEAIKGVLDKIFERQNSFLEAEVSSYQSIDEIYQTMEEYQSFIAQFEEELLSGIEQQTEDQINKLDKLNSSLSKAYKNLLDEVKRKLDERRKEEDNAKTESDISKKQQRLAALQADTSGGHQVEIARLQKEIAEAQQNYQRTLEDQLLERLQNQGDEAEKQRQRQIELLEAQRDIAQQTGTNLAQVKEWLSDPNRYKEEIKSAWLANKDYDSLPEDSQKQLREEFEATWAKYQGYGIQIKKYDDMIETLKSIEGKIDEVDKDENNSIISSVKAMSEAGISASILRAGGWSAKDLTTDNAYSVGSIVKAGYKKNELKDAGIGVEQIRQWNKDNPKNKISAKTFKAANFSAAEAKDANYSNKEIHDANYSIAEFKKATKTKGRSGAAIARKAGYSYKQIASAYGSKAAATVAMTTSNMSGRVAQNQTGATARTLQQVINKSSKDKATQKDLAGVQVGKVDINGKKKGGTIKDSHISSKGTTVGANKGSTLYTADWDEKTGKVKGKWTAHTIDKLTAALIKKYPTDGKQALEYAIKHTKVGSKINKNFNELVKAAGIAGKTYKLKSGTTASLGSANIHYNGVKNKKDGVYVWNPSTGKISFREYDKDKFKKWAKDTKTGREYQAVLHKKKVKGYATGGLANFTGPAWLDGTPSKPELVLNAADTQNFIALKDVLSRAINSIDSSDNYGNVMYEININVDKIEKDYDVDRVVDKVKKEIVKSSGYRNVTQVRNLR